MALAVPRYRQIQSGGWALATPPRGARGSQPGPTVAGGAAPKPPISGVAPTAQQLGLNTKSKTPFNPLGIPSTVGAFNQQLYGAAQSQYMPQLQGVAGDVASEAQANRQRTSDIGSIYGQYQTQAQQAFNEAQAALKSLITNNATTDTNARGTLQAALQAASGPSSTLSDMMGGATAPNAVSDLPYNAAALAGATNNQNFLSNLAASATGGEAQQLANPALERASSLNVESQRHQAAGTALQGNRDAIIAQIPSIIEKERQTLIQNIQSAEGLGFQQTLAAKQFGLASTKQAADISATQAQLGEQQKVDTANIGHQKAQDQIAAALAKNTIRTDQATLANQLNVAQGKQEANAIAALQAWVAPTAQELLPKGTQTIHNPDGSDTKVATGGGVNPKTWHRDAGTMLLTLMTTYGLTEDRALQLMSGLTTPLGGNNGAMTIGQWAKSFRQRALDRRAKGLPPLVGTNPRSPVGQGIGAVAGAGRGLAGASKNV